MSVPVVCCYHCSYHTYSLQGKSGPTKARNMQIPRQHNIIETKQGLIWHRKLYQKNAKQTVAAVMHPQIYLNNKKNLRTTQTVVFQIHLAHPRKRRDE